jgi:superfamily II DNA or RNA helicase
LPSQPPQSGSFEFIEVQLHEIGQPLEKGLAFERLCVKYLQSAPRYRDLFKNIWHFRDWPGNWGIDKGVDLIAETHSGDLWAIQAKAYGEDKSITKRDIDSFLSDSNRPEITHRLLIATTDNIGRNAKETLASQEKGVSTCLRGNLVQTEVVWPTSLTKSFKALPKKKPRDHQKAAIRDVLKGFKTNKRGQMIMACGTGKTLAALWINERLKSRRTLVLVPSLSLVSQMLDEWNQNSKATFETLVVCSDETVLRRGEDSPVASSTTLGIPVTTDPDEIRRFLRKKHEAPAVVFSTYQSSDRIAEAQTKGVPEFDLVIADEAHRCAGREAGLFATVLDQRKIKAKRRLFVTATPRYFTKSVQEKSNEVEDALASMDDHVTFGPVLHKITFAEAIEKDLLTDYQVVIIGVTDSEVRNLVDQSALVKTGEGQTTDARTLASQIAVAKAMRKYDLKKVISFHSTVAAAQAFSDSESATSLAGVIKTLKRSSRPSGKLWSNHVSGKTPTGKRTNLIKHFAALPEGTRGLLSNCSCLGEGVDVPVLDGVAFVAPKRSQVDIIQAVGRVIRLAKGKEIGTIVIPLFIDQSEDADEALSRSAFEPIWRVLCALRAHDASLADELDHLRLRLGDLTKRPGKLRLPAKIKIDLHRSLPSAFEDAFYLRTVETTTNRQFLPFEEARAFVHKLELQGTSQWHSYCQGAMTNKFPKPENIPSNPHRTYKNSGWAGIGDWLGTGTIATHLRKYREFKLAREFAHQLGLKTQRDWSRYCNGEFSHLPQIPPDIPRTPRQVYIDDGWVSFGDWIGTAVKIRQFASARLYVQGLGLKSNKDWRAYCKGELSNFEPKPTDIPSNPARRYKNTGWKDWGDWLGTGNVADQDRTYWNFVRARKFVRKLKLKYGSEWKLYCKGELDGYTRKPDDIPAHPMQTYRDKGWKGMGDWLGTGNLAPKDKVFWTFSKARTFVRELGMKNEKEWRLYVQDKLPGKPKKPIYIPSNPNYTYRETGWVSMGDWLGTGYVHGRYREYLSFAEARKFVRKLNLKSGREYKLYCQGELDGYAPKPANIPTNPSRSYQNRGWIGSGDWLGTGRIADQNKEYRLFEEAQRFVHTLNLKIQKDWSAYCKGEFSHLPQIPPDIPRTPSQVYKDKGWKGMGDWLGTGKPPRGIWREFKAARKFVRKLKIKKQLDWFSYTKGELPGYAEKPSDIPSTPSRAYKDKGWAGLADWLGK